MPTSPSEILLLVIGFFIVLGIWKGIKIVPQQEAWVIQKLGSFDRVLEPGLNLLIPYIERVAYKHSLKEDAIDVPSQAAITKDNVTLEMDGILYVRIINPERASYGVENPYYAVKQLAQTTMRSEIGKISLDKTFEEREALNVQIVNAINEASEAWGIQCMRYEIKDINPPQSILKAMEQQVTAEREKRAQILDSEGEKQAQINRAEGEKQKVVLESEADKINQINRAEGEAAAILAVATATAEGIEKVAVSMEKKGGEKAASLKIAEQYVSAFSNLAKESNTILLPANAGDAGSMVAQAMAVFGSIKNGGQSSAVNPWDYIKKDGE